MGKAAVKPAKVTGKYISPKAWNEVIADPDSVVVDARNYGYRYLDSCKTVAIVGSKGYPAFDRTVEKKTYMCSL